MLATTLLNKETILQHPVEPRRRKWQPTAVFLPGKSHGQRRLAGYSPWGRKSWTRLSDCTNNQQPVKPVNTSHTGHQSQDIKGRVLWASASKVRVPDVCYQCQLKKKKITSCKLRILFFFVFFCFVLFFFEQVYWDLLPRGQSLR